MDTIIILTAVNHDDKRIAIMESFEDEDTLDAFKKIIYENGWDKGRSININYLKIRKLVDGKVK